MYMLAEEDSPSSDDVRKFNARRAEERNATSKIMIWHERLGHINLNSMKTLKKLNVVEGLDIDLDCNELVCEHCIKCKLSAKPFPNGGIGYEPFL